VSSSEDPENLRGMGWANILNFMIDRPVQQSGPMILTKVLYIDLNKAIFTFYMSIGLGWVK
jgi:hypothetical protein